MLEKSFSEPESSGLLDYAKRHPTARSEDLRERSRHGFHSRLDALEKSRGKALSDFKGMTAVPADFSSLGTTQLPVQHYTSSVVVPPLTPYQQYQNTVDTDSVLSDSIRQGLTEDDLAELLSWQETLLENMSQAEGSVASLSGEAYDRTFEILGDYFEEKFGEAYEEWSLDDVLEFQRSDMNGVEKEAFLRYDSKMMEDQEAEDINIDDVDFSVLVP